MIFLTNISVCTFDWKMHFWYDFQDSMSSSRSTRQFQGQMNKHLIIINTNKNCFFNVILTTVDMLRAQKWAKPHF